MSNAMHRLLPILVATIVAASGCDGGSSGPPPGPGAITQAGGTVVGSGALSTASVEVPPGALASGVTITIGPAADIVLADHVTVGPAVAFAPAGTAFATFVVLTVPFDPARLPVGATAADVLLLQRDETTSPPTVTVLTPFAVDAVNGTVRFIATRLTTLQAAVLVIQPPAGVLLFDIAGDTIAEAGGSTTGRMIRTGDVTRPLVVTVLATNGGQAMFPPTVTILAGQTTASFLIDGFDDGQVDGSQTVVLTLTAPGYGPVGASFIVTDEDVQIDAAATAAAFAAARGTAPFDAQIPVLGGVPPYTIQVVPAVGQKVPPGTALSGDGTGATPLRLSGSWDATDPADETVTFTLRVRDAALVFSPAQQFTVALPARAVVSAQGGSTTALATATRSSSYSGEQLSLTGPLAPFSHVSTTFAIAGITYDTGTFAFSGTPTIFQAPTSYSFTFRDATNRLITQPFGITVLNNAALAISPSAPGTLALGPQTIGTLFNQVISIGGGILPYDIQVTGTFPDGISHTVQGAATASPSVTVNGTPATTGQNPSFTITVTDAAFAVVSQTFSIRVVNPAPIIATTVLPGRVRGTFFSQQLAVDDGEPTNVWTFTGTLPSGVNLSGTGLLSGTPPLTGGVQTFNITARVTDGIGRFDDQALSLLVADPMSFNTAATNTNFQNAKDTAPFDAAIVVSGGQTPYAVSVFGGSLPAGVTIQGTGTNPILNGTWNSGGAGGSGDSASFTLQVTDQLGQTQSQVFAVSLQPTTAAVVRAQQQNSTTKLRDAVTLSAYSENFTFNGPLRNASGNYNFVSVTPDFNTTAPDTLAFNPTTFVFSGQPATPASAQTYTFNFTDAAQRPFSRNFALTVFNVAGLELSSNADGTGLLPFVVRGTSFSQQINPLGGVSSSYDFTIPPATTTTLTGLGLVATLSNDPGPNAFLTIAGTAANIQDTQSFTVTCSDAGPTTTINRSFSIRIVNVAPVITTTTLPNALHQIVYSTTLAATQGEGAITWTHTGSLPAGITLSTAGVVSGTATKPTGAPEVFNFTAIATDSVGQVDTQTLSITVISPIQIDQAATQANIDADELDPASFNATIVITGGLPPYDVVLSTGAFPNGTSLQDDGFTSSAPRIAGAWDASNEANATATFEIEVDDFEGQTSSIQSFTATLPVKATMNHTTSLPDGVRNQAYTAQFTASGSSGTLNTVVHNSTTFGSNVAGGINYNTGTRSFSGTPTVTRAPTPTFTFTFRDTAQRVITVTPTFAVLNNVALTLTPSTPALASGDISMPDATEGSNYTGQVIHPNGSGVSPYTVSILQLSGGLQSGMTAVTQNGPFPSAGAQVLLDGTPAAGSASTNFTREQFRVTVTDAVSASFSRDYDIRVINPAPTITQASALSGGKAGTSYSQNLSAQNGGGTLTWDVFSGSFPSGVSFSDTSGVTANINGTPSAAAAELNGNGDHSFTLRVTDQHVDRFGNPAARTDTQFFTLDVRLSYTSNIFPTRTNGPSLNGCIGCHGDATNVKPDFDGSNDTGIANRLISTASNTNGASGIGPSPANDYVCQGNTYVVRGNAGGSFLFNKVSAASNASVCGVCMPFNQCLNMNATARGRLQRWINEMTGADTD